MRVTAREIISEQSRLNCFDRETARSECGAMRMIAQNPIRDLQVSTEYPSDGKVNFWVTLQQSQKYIARESGNRTRFHTCHINLRQFAGNQGAHAKYFASRCVVKRSRPARAVESNRYPARIYYDKLLRKHPLPDENSAHGDDHRLF